MDILTVLALQLVLAKANLNLLAYSVEITNPVFAQNLPIGDAIDFQRENVLPPPSTPKVIGKEVANIGGIKPSKETALLIQCESGNKNIEILDTNGKMSRGIGQFQDSTWETFSKESGIKGTSTNPNDAILMMNWALEHGKARHWLFCSQKNGLLTRADKRGK